MDRIQKIVALVIALASVGWTQAVMKAEPTTQEKQVISTFEKRVDDYLSLRKKEAGSLPSTTSSPEKLAESQKQLAEKVRESRSGAKQGNIFTPEIADYFRKQIAATLRGVQGAKILTSLRHSEPVKGIGLAVNGAYPQNIPLQSTPPSLLMNLPPLPKQLEYRMVNQDLVLRDTSANIIVDFLPHALPAV